MVAIKSHEADRFLARPTTHVFLYLVHGTDNGLVAERVKTIVARSVDDPKDPFQFLRLDGDDLAADPQRLADEAHTVPLFGGRRAILIGARGKAFIQAVEPILAVPPQDCTIIVEAGALKKDNALRKLCERDKNAAAIECYPDSQRDLQALIEAETAATRQTIRADAKEELLSLLGADRLTTRGELDKLLLYTHGEAEITLSHVEAIVADASSLFVDGAINAAFAGEATNADRIARRVFEEAGDANMLLGMALRQALSLHRAKLDKDMGLAPRGGAPFAASWRMGNAEQHLSRWSVERLSEASTLLGEAVRQARREPKLAEAIALRALWSVAFLARGKTFR
ncbi:DNA polymerase III subunit delta [Beijerinckia indica]|uniref:DNA polymerase III subunit delta n=1 Tax=Beijerinckia indica subsp. indica (strain ATCC 9039 / DSM 1715 / NCIMB 8712) TaxID=395963 RepID=B2ICI9_BEII9|nr:DNA polymerase III subunit delta [Beijerinckia indica]ACB93878.1 DNA polymerase III, delta subunit [Beijerinckia indica subsp. indica ATCC 9039]